MRQRIPLALTILALGCRGHLIDDNGSGGNQPPTTNASFAIQLSGQNAEQVADVAADPLGNVYVTGTFNGITDFDPGSGTTALTSLGGTDGFLAKYSPSGSLQWVSRFGGSGTENVTSLVRDASGNLYVGGSFSGAADFDPGPGFQVLNSLGDLDGFVAKYSGSGDLVWVRRFGGTASDQVNDLAVDAAGNVYAVGAFLGQANSLPAAGPTLVADGSAIDGFVLALDAGGTIRWALPIGGNQDDEVRAVAVGLGGSITVAGSFHGGADFARNATAVRLTAQGGADLFLAQYSSAGQLAWTKDIGGTSDESMPTRGLSLDGQGGAVLVGQFAGSADFDPGPGLAARTSFSTADLFLARYDANGNFVSVGTMGGPGTVSGTRVLADADGSVLLTGSFTGSLDFDPGAGTTTLASLGQAGATDAFAARYSATGSLVWVSRFGEATSAADRLNGATALALDPTGFIVVGGNFFGSPDFDPGSSALVFTSLGESDGFALKLTPGGSLATNP